jgi:linearmycin/streptolysin S transport system permease protein
MTALTIAGANLRRTLRDRTNLFFVVLFPLLMITVLGLAFGGQTAPRVAVVADDSQPLAQALVAELRDTSLEVQEYGDRAAAVSAVETGRVEAALVVAPSYQNRLEQGADVTVEYLSRADRSAQQVAMIVRGTVDSQAARLRVARTLEDRVGGDLAANLERTDAAAAGVSRVAVRSSTAGTALFPEDLGRFDLGASGQLLLFIFITSMTTSTALIETRQLGVARRMFAAPTRVSGIVLGEALGRVGVAVVQGLVIMLGSALIFGVSWGNPLGAGLLMLVFATVAGAAGLLLGAAAGTPQQAISIGLLVGIGLSALGGSMMPLEFFSPTMLKVAHLTPHAWAADGYATLVRHGGSVLDVLPELGVLVAFAAALFTAGSWVLRRRITHG